MLRLSSDVLTLASEQVLKSRLRAEEGLGIAVGLGGDTIESATGLLVFSIVGMEGLLVVDLALSSGLTIVCCFLASLGCWLLGGRDLIGCDCCSERLVASGVGV